MLGVEAGLERKMILRKEKLRIRMAQNQLNS